MKKFASKHGSQLVLKDDGKYSFQISKKEWTKIGKQAGWIKKSVAQKPEDMSIEQLQQAINAQKMQIMGFQPDDPDINPQMYQQIQQSIQQLQDILVEKKQFEKPEYKERDMGSWERDQTPFTRLWNAEQEVGKKQPPLSSDY